MNEPKTKEVEHEADEKTMEELQQEIDELKEIAVKTSDQFHDIR